MTYRSDKQKKNKPNTIYTLFWISLLSKHKYLFISMKVDILVHLHYILAAMEYLALHLSSFISSARKYFPSSNKLAKSAATGSRMRVATA